MTKRLQLSFAVTLGIVLTTGVLTLFGGLSQAKEMVYADEKHNLSRVSKYQTMNQDCLQEDLSCSTPASMFTGRGPIPGLISSSTYIVYYGTLDEETITKLKAFDLVILHPDSNLTSAQVSELQMAGVIVLLYISIGEEPSGVPTTDDIAGPVYYDPASSCHGVPDRGCENNGISSYYLDEITNTTGAPGHDGLPDVHLPWNSRNVDPASPLWRSRIKTCVKNSNGCNFFGTDHIINTLGADGLFLDTVDTASPWHHWQYTLDPMADFICTISDWYPNKYIVLNRGIFYADTIYGADTVRPCINGVVWEAYYSEWDWEKNEGRISPWFQDNRDNWAPKLNAQASMTDGYTVFALDYFTATQTISITDQISETKKAFGWLDYISTPYLDKIRWEVWAYCRGANTVYLPIIKK